MRRGRGKLKVGKSKRKKFKEEELKGIEGYQTGKNYVELDCGCTNKKYGDFGGRIRISVTGQFLITCHCFEGCEKVNITPKEFEKHALETEVLFSRKWTANIWIQIEGEKIPVGKSPVMKYYSHKANMDNWIKHVSRNKKFHKDEFIRCTKCNKERRFRRRNMKQLRDYHDALSNKSWECSDWPYNKITCEEEEERESSKLYRGCPRVTLCKGCDYCICTGCLKCRFLSCNCQECTAFMNEAKP